MAAGDPIKLGCAATKFIFGLLPEKPFCLPAWMPGAELIKLRSRPEEFPTAFVRYQGSVRSYVIHDEHYYLTIGFETGRNQRPPCHK